MDELDSSFPFKFQIAPDVGELSPTLEYFFRQQITSLLDVVVLTSNGQPVEVDGFLWMKDAFRKPHQPQAKPFSICPENQKK